MPRLRFTAVKKKTVGGTAASSGAVHLAAMETNIFHQLPSLVAHCTTTKYDDGDPRQPGWFTVKTMGAAWMVMVKDPDSCAQFSATASTLDDALQLAELLLSADEAPWEPDPWAKRKKVDKKTS